MSTDTEFLQVLVAEALVPKVLQHKCLEHLRDPEVLSTWTPREKVKS